MNFNEFLSVIPLFKDIGSNIKTWRKDPNFRQVHSVLGMKTEADLRSHDFIFSKLTKLFPGVEIISEENYSENFSRPKSYWLVDPIDGTASWYNGFNGYVTQASFIDNDDPIFGIIYAPEYEKIWVGAKNRGAKLNGIKLKNLSSSDKLVFIDNTKIPHGITNQLMKAMGSNSYYESGSIGLKSVLVADGTVDLFVKDIIVRDWDLAPAYVILREVGGCLASYSGSDYVFSGPMEKKDGFIVARDSKLLDKAICSIKTIQEINN